MTQYEFFALGAHDRWLAYDALAGDLAETRIALANAECRERVAKSRLALCEKIIRENLGPHWQGIIESCAADSAEHRESAT